MEDRATDKMSDKQTHTHTHRWIEIKMGRQKEHWGRKRFHLFMMKKDFRGKGLIYIESIGIGRASQKNSINLCGKEQKIQ